MATQISSLEVLAVEGAGPVSVEPSQRQVRPLDIYAEDRAPLLHVPDGAGGPPLLRALYLRVKSSDGPEGLYGPIDEPVARVVMSDLEGFLVGQDALAGEVVWDKLQRLDRHSRHGHLKMAISAVDNALWDLRGKAFGAPVWQLLGGPSRSDIPVYASTLGLSHEPGELEKKARELVEAGFSGQKWFFAHGPGDGWRAMGTNIELVERLRETVGPVHPIMFDAFMAWDLSYARQWASAVEQLSPAWLEEPLAPGSYAGYRELRKSTRIPLAAGEHLYDRAEVLPFLSEGLISVLQTDPEWCGGVTELVRLCNLAEVFGVPVIPHGHGLHAALHVVASRSPQVCPMMEYLVNVMPSRHYFDKAAPVPANGHIKLPTAAGFGIELDQERATRVSPWAPFSKGAG